MQVRREVGRNAKFKLTLLAEVLFGAANPTCTFTFAVYSSFAPVFKMNGTNLVNAILSEGTPSPRCQTFPGILLSVSKWYHHWFLSLQPCQHPDQKNKDRHEEAWRLPKVIIPHHALLHDASGKNSIRLLNHQLLYEWWVRERRNPVSIDSESMRPPSWIQWV